MDPKPAQASADSRGDARPPTAAQTEKITILPPDQTLYFNGFAVALGMGDVVTTLTRNGTPVLTLNCSYTVAKTLAVALTHAIDKLQEKTGQTIMTVQSITKATEGST